LPGARSDAERRGEFESPGLPGARSDAERRGELIEKRAASQSEARNKRAGTDPHNISQVWYEDDEAEAAPKRRKPSPTSSTTDMSLYDELPPRKSRLPLVIGALGLLAIGGVAFALTRDGGNSTKTEPPKQPAIAAVDIVVDAAPSQIITPEVTTPDAATAVAITPPSKKIETPSKIPSGATTTQPTKVAQPTKKQPGDVGGFVLGSEEPAFRRPGGGTTPPPTGTSTTGTSPTGTTPTGTTPTGTGSTTTTGTSPTGTSPPKDQPTITDGPTDPYEEKPPEPSGETAATPEKKAEFFANLGAQQLASGDTANAASNFKKALEIDPRNTASIIGLGEIALRQGLNGDAIAHLRKAARMAPTSSRVFTLLGEAFLNSGNTKEAITNFQKALKLDPDNQRAKDGFAEANARANPTEE
jgi:Tetratricopeptide repeat